MLSQDNISQMISFIENNIFKQVFVIESLQQIATIIVIMLLSWGIALKSSKRIKALTENLMNPSLASIVSKIYLSAKEIVLLIVSPIMLWAAVTIAMSLEFHFAILNGAASLVTAWAVIRLGSSIIKSDFWSKALAYSIWSIAALNILGWLEPTVQVLDHAIIPLGKDNLSLLSLIKGGVIFALLLWAASLAADGMEKILDRSKLSPSQKVLLHKLLKIFFIALAVLIALDVVGIDFTALAVFSGALGIGIGFGLQKVFSNLMSGFILLMDKSIKPGDVIAIANTYGWVNRLGARYVSILTRDGKEHLIPNETLITQRVENWSYSDDKIRILTPIGVSYKADIPLVKKLLLEVAAKLPRVLKDPAPVCLITGFGDNSVDFEIRVWIKDPINGTSNVRSDLYAEIWQTFKEHNIEIPFPQRDINFNMQQIQKMIELANDKAA